MHNFHNKQFQITFIDGPEAEVNEETLFEFRQDGKIVSAEYSGGNIKIGRLLGLLDGNTLHHRYIQVNQKNELHSGAGNSLIALSNSGKLQIIEEWEWESKAGRGKSIMEEI